MHTVVYGKWILVGEHAVLRGCPALVFPVFGKSLTLDYQANDLNLSVDFSGEHGEELRLLFWGVMERALQLARQPRESIKGSFSIRNSIPIGAGLGASAALCVAIGRWFSWQGFVNKNELSEFCRLLENMFHGESSGVDIAVALSGKGLHFERNGNRFEIEPSWSPNWFISYSGKRGVTSECISKVKDLWVGDQPLGQKIDAEMKEAVELAEMALKEKNVEVAFDQLAEAINKGRSCFEHWGLASGQVGDHLQELLNLGAYAVKPTGSGDGGFVLSLWRKAPPESIRHQLISLNDRQGSMSESNLFILEEGR